MKKTALLVFLIVIAICSCDKDTVTSPKEKKYDVGKNRFTTAINGDTREYYVHVPTGYNDNSPTPAVFILHGTSGDGEKFYNISGWKEVGEAANILTIYPSSWHHCIIDEGQIKNTTKWNIYPGAFEYCSGEIPRDDIKFLKQIISELNSNFNVDIKRMYLVGFSNGGQMAFRCAVEMSDVFAAIVEASGSISRDTTAVPKRDLPVTFQIGNSDDIALGSSSETVPMSLFEDKLNNAPVFQEIVHSHTSTFNFTTQYTISGDTNTVLIATYPGIPPSSNRNFNFILVKDLDHQYPNGINHWLKGAELHWQWFKQYTLP